MQINLERVVGPKKLAGGWGLGVGGGVGGQKFKSEKAHVNTHMHINLQRVVGQLGGGGSVGGGVRNSKARKSTCEHTYTHAYSSTKGSRPNKY